MPNVDPREAMGKPAPALPTRGLSRNKKGFPWRTTAALLLVAAIAIVAAKRRIQAAPDAKSAPAAKGGSLPVSVIIGTVTQKDVPIYLDGLGTVQAFNTVTVRARVDGEVQKLSFVEGQDVREGDLLAQIDPAPLQTQLDQAVAKKAQDQAQLTVARVTLQRDEKLLGDK